MAEVLKKSIVTCMLLLAGTASVAVGGKPKFEITEALVKSLSPEMQKEVAGLQYILNPYQLRQFFSLPTDSLRRDWIDTFWSALDPTPTTPKNEMMIEHYVRVRLAMQFFNSEMWPGWDKRGEIFIRYGPPNYRGRIHAEVTARKIHPPGELWFYKRHAMVVQFEDFNLDGNYNYAMTPLGVARDMNPELMEFLLYDTDDALQEQIPDYLLNFERPSELIESDADWTPLHDMLFGVEPKQDVQMRMRGLHEGMDEIIDPDTPNMVPENPSYTFHEERIKKYANNFEVVLAETPSAYPFNFEDRSFPFYFAVDQFKGGTAVNRVEVNIEFPADLSPGEENLLRKTYTASAVFLDADYEEIARDASEVALPTVQVDSADKDEEKEEEEEDSGNVRLMPVQLLFTLPEKYYRLAVTVEDVVSGKASSYKTTMVYNDYRFDLAISDILFCSKIAPAERQSPFNRGALEAVPHPLRRYARSGAVPVYFEVYNLELDDDGLSQYTVEYRITPHSPRKRSFWDQFEGESPIVSSRFESSSYGSTDQLYISVGTENLREGAFDLMITVTDEITQAVVFRKATFQIVE